MPGTNKWRTLNLVNRSWVRHYVPYRSRMTLICNVLSIESRKIMVRTIKERAKKVLELTQKCAQGAPEVFPTFSPTQGILLMFSHVDPRWRRYRAHPWVWWGESLHETLCCRIRRLAQKRQQPVASETQSMPRISFTFDNSKYFYLGTRLEENCHRRW